MGSIQDDKHSDLRDPSLIKKLQSSLTDSKVLTPHSEEYAAKTIRWSEASEKKAGAIVLAASAADISKTILFTRSWFLDLAVCCGGHSGSGSSSSKGGLVIDLSLMRNVTVDPASKTVKAQGGCLWADVDHAAWEHGLATVGGTVNHTGIGGLTLGGGYGWLSGKYGLTIDNLLAVQMVLADGSIVTASESENSDLFWAVRGAGQSFGVVVEFTYRAYPQNRVWAGLLGYPPTKLEAIAAAANQISAASHGDSGLMLVLAQPPPKFQTLALAVVYFNGPASAAEESFAPLLALNPILNTAEEIPYSELNAITNPANSYGARKTFKGTSFVAPLRPAFFQSVFDDYVRFLEQIPGVSGSIVLEFLKTDKIYSVPHTATAFANRGKYQNALICPRWVDPVHDEACRSWTRAMAAKFVEEMKSEVSQPEKEEIEVEGVRQYGNYDSFVEKGPVIFGSNYERVVQLKRKYDPYNVFNKSHVQIEV